MSPDTTNTPREGQKRGQGQLIELHDALLPSLGDKAKIVCIRLAAAIEWRAGLSPDHAADQRDVQQRRHEQMTRIQLALRELKDAVKASDLEVQGRIGTEFVVLFHQADDLIFDAANQLPPVPANRPKEEARELLTLEIARALEWSGISPATTDDGTFEKVVRIVLPFVGESVPVDVQPLLRAALKRLRSEGSSSGAESNPPESPT